MCTLTYRLTSWGYQLFFNRDEQNTRPQALKPTLDRTLKSIYPIDPSGGGTWIAVHENGTSLALLNYYQAKGDVSVTTFTSRGAIIPALLSVVDIHAHLRVMDFSAFQPFQLCIFDNKLSMQSGDASQYVWDGKELHFSPICYLSSLPITSSSVDFEAVSAYRKQQYNQMMMKAHTNAMDFIHYHHEAGVGAWSVKMQRKDAKTVSFTQITVKHHEQKDKKIEVEYRDHISQETSFLSC